MESTESNLLAAMSAVKGNREKIKVLGKALGSMSEKMLSVSEKGQGDMLGLSGRQLGEMARSVEKLGRALDGPEKASSTHYSRSTAAGWFSADEDGVSVNLPGGGEFSAGRDGVKVEVPNGGSVSVGGDGVSVDLPDGSRVGVDTDGTVTMPDGSTYEPPFKAPPSGSGSKPGNFFEIPVPQFGTTPLRISIPVPEFQPKPFEIPIPVPQFECSPLKFPNQFPNFEMPQLAFPNLTLANPLAGFEWVWEQMKEIQEGVRSFAEEDPLVEALRHALLMWKLRASFSDVKIMTITAIGATGCLRGPRIRDDMRYHSSLASLTGEERAFANAVCEGVSKNFERWRAGVTVPGLPWYPMFAAFPGPAAPPMPNVPMPLLACVSGEVDGILNPSRIEDSIRDELGSEAAAHSDRIKKVSLQAAAALALWYSTAMVRNAMGRGPIPSYAPPAVPVGPVVNGEVLPIPGVLQ